MSTELQTSTLIGRRDELAAAEALVRSARLTTLTGIGGTGKTVLAAEVVARFESPAVPVWTVELGEIHDPGLVGSAVTRALGLQIPGADDSAVADYIGDREAVIFLDNCEHLPLACAALVSLLLSRCQNLRIVATSRQSLGVVGEQVYAVPPMSLPDPEDVVPDQDLATIARSDAVQLFVSRARAASPDFELTDRNAVTVARLCRALEGVPLAIELAASRSGVLAPDAILERLHDRYRLLSVDIEGLPTRQKSLSASVSWSWDLCTEAEREVWARLSVFSGGFDLDDAEAVCGGGQVDPDDVLDLVDALLTKSLVLRDPETEAAHYRMLETIRQYGAQQLEESGQAEEVRRRHRTHFLTLGERCGLDWIGQDQLRWVRRLQRSHGNVLAAFEQASSVAAEAPAVLRAVVELETYWVSAGLMTEARRWGMRALSTGEGSTQERALGLAVTAYFASVQMNLQEARVLLSEESDLARHSDSVRVAAYHDLATAMQLLFSGDAIAAVEPCALAQNRFATIGAERPRCTASASLNVMYLYAGQLQQCIGSTEELLARLPGGELYFHSFAHWTLASALLASGDLERAGEVARRALQEAAELDNQLGLAWAFETLAATAAAGSDATASATMLGAAQAIWRRVGESSLSAPYLTAHRELAEQLARDSLEDRAFNAAYLRGQTLTQAEAVAVALGAED